MDEQDIFWDMGGELTVNAAIDPFFERILSDPLIAPFFEKVPLEHQLRTRKMFLALLFGGLEGYSIEHMRNSHRPMVENSNLGDEHFDAILTHLLSTLEELKVKPEFISIVMERAENTRNDVLCR